MHLSAFAAPFLLKQKQILQNGFRFLRADVCVQFGHCCQVWTLMEIEGFSRCIAANKQQACRLAAAASCGMVAVCEFFVCKLVLLLLSAATLRLLVAATLQLLVAATLRLIVCCNLAACAFFVCKLDFSLLVAACLLQTVAAYLLQTTAACLLQTAASCN